AAGMRLLGPACYGLVASGPSGRLDATPRQGLAAGGLALYCQSAAAGGVLLGAVQGRGIGLRRFGSAGDRADVAGNDTRQARRGGGGGPSGPSRLAGPGGAGSSRPGCAPTCRAKTPCRRGGTPPPCPPPSSASSRSATPGSSPGSRAG